MSGPFGSSQWMYNAGGGFYDFPISNSLRFNRADSTHLKFTPSSAGNRKTWTFSTWVKRSMVGAIQSFIDTRAAINATQLIHIAINNDDKLYIGSGAADLRTSTQVFRDTSAWYHFVCAYDSTNSTADNRIRLYVNGEEITSFSIKNNPSQNSDSGINQTAQHCIGTLGTGTGNFLNGYLADTCLIEGTALTPSSFGETKNDIWIPKDTSGLTFGDQGWRLQYKQVGTGTASSTTIGADTSGNDNHWTSNNLVASDVVPDSPTNNFATLNPLEGASADPGAFSEGNLRLTSTNANDGGSRGTFGMTTGKWYFEFQVSAISGTIPTFIGVASSDVSLNSWNNGTFVAYESENGNKRIDTTGSSYGDAFGVGDVVGVAVDMDALDVIFYKNNASQGTITDCLTAGTTYFSYTGDSSSTRSATSTINFGQDSSFAGAETAQGNTDENGIGDFYYAPPSGFLALCTANLPAPVETIDPAQGGSPQDYFDSTLWVGTTSTASVIDDLSFQPDWVWIKERSSTSGHGFIDSVRGVSNVLFSNLTDAEATSQNWLASFDSNGFTTGASNNGSNQLDETYVAWNWKAGTAFSNDASATGVGSIDSSGSVNTDVGFSVITATTNGDGIITSAAHGLGVTPEMIIMKSRTATQSWYVYHKNSTATATQGTLNLNTTDAVNTTNGVSGGVDKWTVSSTTFGAGNAAWNYPTNTGHVFYCFASVDGYSKFGGYTGNGSTDGTFVYTGFRPAYFMVKRTNSTSAWLIYDTARNVYNLAGDLLEANTSDAEESNATGIDFLSNGLKMRNTFGGANASGVTYIYMAFAEQPFKYANGR